MLALYLWYAAFLADPVTVVQLRYPAARTTITTTSGFNVFYTVSSDAPPELRRAYKLLEIAERDVLVTDALQQFRLEIVQNERRIESLRTARIVSWLSNDIRGPQLRYFDPAMFAPMDTTLRGGIAINLAGDATVERAQQALDRLFSAHQYLHQTLTAIAYPDQPKIARQPDPAPKLAPAGVPVPAPLPPPAPAAASLLAAERAENTAAVAESVAAERESIARQNERAADTLYRNSLPADRPAAREAWLKAREEWEQARRDWDAARDQWQTARDRLEVARQASPPFKAATRPPAFPRP